MADVSLCPRCGAELPAGAPEQPCPACLMRLGLESWAVANQAETPTRLTPGGFDAPAVEEIAGRFPQLDVLELIGKGGMGAVYRARQRTLDRVVALKIINPAAADDPAFAERFTREARALARLNHPHIVTVHDFGQADGLYYLVMEYVDGTNLRTLIREGRLSPQEALAIVPPLCDALQYAHDEGIVHRDIKPENILLDQKGRVKIADFGLAKLLGMGPADVTLTAAHQAMGTLHYMAPEQLERPQAVDHRADIYSLGVTFYEMLTGELPLGRFAPPSRKVQVDVRLDEVVLRALERDPEQRYQHASDVKTDVSRIAVRDMPGAPVEREWEPDPVILQQVRNPAIGLWVTGIISWVTIPLAFMIPWSDELSPNTAGLVNIELSFGVVPLVVGTFMFLGGLLMQRLESYRLAVTAAVLPMAVLVLKLAGLAFETLAINPADFVGAPMGLWALAVLTKADVRRAFRGHTASAQPSVPPVRSSSADAAVVDQVRTPATWLFVTSIFNWIATPFVLALGVPAIQARLQEQAEPPAIALLLLIPLLSGVMMFAAIKMRRLEAYWLCVTGAVLAMVITPGNLLGLPIGIWSLVVLSSDEVKQSFAARRQVAGGASDSVAGLSKTQRRAIQAVLLIAGLYLANICFTFRGGFDMTATRDGGQTEVAYREYGQFDPWYRWEEKIGDDTGGFSREFDLLSWSALAGLLSLMAFYGMIRLGVGPAASEPPAGMTPLAAVDSAASAHPAHVLRQGAGPAMLALALGYAFSAVVMCVGAGLIAYGLLWSPTGWAGLVGGGAGTFIGGAGGMFGVWNHSRQYRGAASIMHAPHWTGFDSTTLALGLVGLAVLSAGVLLWSTSTYEVRLLLCLLGTLASLQGFGTVLWRWSIRQSLRPREAGAIDPRLYVLAGMMVFSALCMTAGAVMAVIALVMIPIGSAGFWGWMGGACGCFFGGGGGLLGCWNTYRQMEGRSDMLLEQGRNLLDRCMLAMLCIGLALAVAAVSVSPWATSDMVWGGLLIGGILIFQSLIFVVLRALLRRGATQEAAVAQGNAD